MTDPSTGSATATGLPAQPSRSGGRIAGIVTALGSAVYVSGLALPIGGEVYSAEDEATAQALLAESAADWDISMGLAAAGILIAAVGLWLLGRDIVAASAQPRVRRWGAIGGWLGLASGIGAIGQIWLITASPQEVAEGLASAPLILIGGFVVSVGLLGAFVGVGLALIRMPHLRPLGWTLLILGVLTVPTHAFLGPPFSYLLWAIAGVVLAIAPVRDRAAVEVPAA